MNFETARANIPFWIIIAFAIAVATSVFGVWYYHVDANDSKTVGIVGGIISGLIVYLATFITLVYPIRQYERFRQMGVLGLLDNRHDEIYYRKLVETGRERVCVMGASCGRFVQDFLDPANDDHVLIDALVKHKSLKVRLLIPNDIHMSPDARQRVRGVLEKI